MKWIDIDSNTESNIYDVLATDGNTFIMGDLYNSTGDDEDDKAWVCTNCQYTLENIIKYVTMKDLYNDLNRVIVTFTYEIKPENEE